VSSLSSIDALADWLVDGAPGASDSATVVTRIGEDLYAAGVPVHRISAFVRTLHPTVVGRAFRWSVGQPAQVFEATHTTFNSSGVFTNSPVRVVIDTQRELHVKIGPKGTPQKHPVLDDLAAEAFVDYSIEKHGGEVLKFMGDGMLAIFPFAEGDDAGKVADRALDAAHETLAAIAALAPLRIGLALHVGELAYGNIGGSQRLDFTAIGPAVNLTSRLEGLTSKLSRPIVLSDELAKLTTRPTDDLGTFELKGITAPVRAFAPRSPT
jgi:hypothetical protein